MKGLVAQKRQKREKGKCGKKSLGTKSTVPGKKCDKVKFLVNFTQVPVPILQCGELGGESVLSYLGTFFIEFVRSLRVYRGQVSSCVISFCI